MRTIEVNIIKGKNDKIANLLSYVSVQLSDGYFEGEEDFYEEYWNYLEFTGTKNLLKIKIRKNPIWKGTKDIFKDRTDAGVIHYLANVLENVYDDAPHIFDKHENFIEEAINSLHKYKENEPDLKEYKKVTISLSKEIAEELEKIYGKNNEERDEFIDELIKEKLK